MQLQVSSGKSINSKTKKSERTGPIFVWAELSRKDYSAIQRGEMSVVIPEGVSMKNRAGSRILDFTCNDLNSAKILIGALDDSGLPWDEKFVEDVSLEQLMKDKTEQKVGGTQKFIL